MLKRWTASIHVQTMQLDYSPRMETTGKVDGIQSSDSDIRLSIPDREFHPRTGEPLETGNKEFRI